MTVGQRRSAARGAGRAAPARCPAGSCATPGHLRAASLGGSPPLYPTLSPTGGERAWRRQIVIASELAWRCRSNPQRDERDCFAALAMTASDTKPKYDPGRGRIIMATFRPTADLEMHYEVDDFIDPWRRPEVVLLLHGNAESGARLVGLGPEAWPAATRWSAAGHARRFWRIDRPMPRRFFRGRSTSSIDDYARLMDHLSGSTGFTLVGAKIGGTIARAFAARRPERVTTLTVVGTPPPLRAGAAEHVPELNAAFERDGVEAWARQTMGGRLGGDFPAEGVEWWIKFMGRTAVSTQLGFSKDDRLRRHSRRFGEDLLPDPGRHHRRQRPRLGRRNPRLAQIAEFAIGGVAGRLVPCRRDPCRALRRGNARFHRRPRRRLNGPAGRPQRHPAQRCLGSE